MQSQQCSAILVYGIFGSEQHPLTLKWMLWLLLVMDLIESMSAKDKTGSLKFIRILQTELVYVKLYAVQLEI